MFPASASAFSRPEFHHVRALVLPQRLPVLLTKHPPARSTCPSAVGIDVRVLGRVLVPSFAMRLAPIIGRDRLAPQNILASRDRFEMGGVDAAAVPAEVINDEPRRYWANVRLVEQSVRQVLFSVAPRVAVAVGAFPGPLPAIAGRGDTSQDAIRQHQRSVTHGVSGVLRRLRMGYV